MTPEGAARVAAETAMSRVFDGHETRPLMERCVVWTHEGPPLLPPAYNDIHQIFQTQDHFVLFTELATNPPRIMALDGRPGLPDAIRQFAGDSRARWEGTPDTLVVETGNFIARRNYRGSNRFRHIVERFTLVDADTIRYEFTITDPTTWTSPWSLGSTATPASSPIHSLASAKLTLVAASPTSRAVAGDSEVSCRPRARSRGQLPLRQAAQW